MFDVQCMLLEAAMLSFAHGHVRDANGPIALLETCFARRYNAISMDLKLNLSGMHTVVNVSASMRVAAKRDRLCIHCIVQYLQTHLVFQHMIC